MISSILHYYPIRETEGKSIYMELNGEIEQPAFQDCKNGTSLINEEFQECCKNITSLINEEFQSRTSLQNVKPTILGIDLAKEEEDRNGLDNN